MQADKSSDISAFNHACIQSCMYSCIHVIMYLSVHVRRFLRLHVGLYVLTQSYIQEHNEIFINEDKKNIF